MPWDAALPCPAMCPADALPVEELGGMRCAVSDHEGVREKTGSLLLLQSSVPKTVAG